MIPAPEFHILPLPHGGDYPWDLLELADPSRDMIGRYLQNGTCFVVRTAGKTLGVMVLLELDLHTLEIKNIAVEEDMQGRGIGKALLRHAEAFAREKGYVRLLIGTGNSSFDQLGLYQKSGFRIFGLKKNFFLDNYPEPIFENGIQVRDMVMLEMRLD